MNLLPPPRSLQRRAGNFLLPRRVTVQLDPSVKPGEARLLRQRLQSWSTGQPTSKTPWSVMPGKAGDQRPAAIRVIRSSALAQPAALAKQARLKPGLRTEDYALTIDHSGILIEFHETPGLRAAVSTLRQLLREYGRRLPCLRIRDWPDFSRRGVMLDISRGRVPKLETLLDLADTLADFKINELQLYTEHTFAYRNYKSVWRDWGALTAAEIRTLDARCRQLGIDLVPNQNSFGHLREFLASPKLKPLAEIAEPWPDGAGTFWRYPSTFAPNHPGTLRFLRELYDELLPNFTSPLFNVGCDETWDLGRGQSRALCQKQGRGRVYLNFIRRIHREVSRRGKRMMFWGDIILHEPQLISKLPRNIIALNWGYEPDHPFAKEARQFARAGIPFYVCPGTSTWATLIGKHENAFANLRAAAKAGRANGAIGYLITDWGDGGHPQPLAVSWLPFLFGAAMAWNGTGIGKDQLLTVASRDVFHDPTGHAAKATLDLGLAHRKLNYLTPNATPLGATLAAPRPETHELFCRDGLKYYARVSGARIRSALKEIERQRQALRRNRATSEQGKRLARELDLAARMAAQSGKLMLWQQALASGQRAKAKRMAQLALRELRELERDFNEFWPQRNKATPAKCSPFFQWRIADYLCGRLHFPPEIARKSQAD